MLHCVKFYEKTKSQKEKTLETIGHMHNLNKLNVFQSAASNNHQKRQLMLITYKFVVVLEQKLKSVVMQKQTSIRSNGLQFNSCIKLNICSTLFESRNIENVSPTFNSCGACIRNENEFFYFSILVKSITLRLVGQPYDYELNNQMY